MNKIYLGIANPSEAVSVIEVIVVKLWRRRRPAVLVQPDVEVAVVAGIVCQVLKFNKKFRLNLRQQYKNLPFVRKVKKEKKINP